MEREGRWDDLKARREAASELGAGGDQREVYAGPSRRTPISRAEALADKKIIDGLCADCVGRESTEVRDVRWVFDNIGVPWADIDVDGIPSRGAVSMLKTAKENPQWFYRDMWKPLLKAADEGDGAYKDDGRKVLELIDSAMATGKP
jgi:hypothetical protein